MMQKLLLFFTLLAQAFAKNNYNHTADRDLADFSNGDPFMRYLAPLTFGRSPGPCPDVNNKCEVDYSQIPQSIKDIKVFLGFSIGQIVKSGNFAIWDLTCSNIEMDSLTFSLPSNPFVVRNGKKRELKVGLRADDIALNCRMEAHALNMKVFGANTNIRNLAISFTKNKMTGDGRGLQLNAETRWFSPDFDASFPSTMNFLTFGGSTDACQLSISDGLNLDFNNPLGNFFVNAIFFLFKGIIEGVICNMLVQLAFIDGNTNNPGLINEKLADLFSTVQRYQRQGLKDDGDLLGDEKDLSTSLSNKGLAELEKDVNFKTDKFFEGISLGLNNILGGPSSNPAYSLVINEVMDLLIGDTSGTFASNDVRELFKLDNYPTFSFQGAASGIDLSLKSFEFRGLNKFTDFRVIDNKFDNKLDGFEYTLKTIIDMNALGISMNLDMVFVPGEWVTSPSNPASSQPINFDLNINMQDLSVVIANFVLIQPDLLQDVQVGQILGPTQTLENILDCSAQLFDYLNFASLALRYGSMDDPSFSSASSLGDLIDEIASVFVAVSSGAMNVQFPFIVENFIRVKLNEVMDRYFVDAANGLKNCPVYESQVFDPESFQAADSLTVGFFSRFIKTVFGGDPVGTSDASVNAVMNTVLLYYLIDREKPLFSGVFVSPEPGTYVMDQKIAVDVNFNEGNKGPGTHDLLLMQVDGPSFANVDSVAQMLVNQVSSNGETDPYSAEVIIQYGYYSGPGSPLPDVSPLRLSMPFRINSVLDGILKADEDFDIVLDLALDIQFLVSAEIDKDKTFQSTFGMFLNHIACDFAVLNSKELKEMNLGVNTAEFSLIANQDFSQETDFGKSLAALQADIGTHPGFATHVINYLLERVAVESKNVFNTDFDPPFEIETCTEVESPLANTSFASKLPSINISAINEFLNNATSPQKSPRGTSPSVFEKDIIDKIINLHGPKASIFDITNRANGFLSIISGAFTPDTLREAMITLANTTADPENPSVFDFLTKSLVLEPQTQAEIDAGQKPSVSFVFDIGNDFKLNYDPTVDSFIEDLKIVFQPLKVKNVQNFRKINILNPYKANGEVSLFTTSNDFSYGGGDLELELIIDIEMNSDVIDVDNTIDEEIISERIKVNILLQEIDVKILLSVAADNDKIKDTFMGDLVQFNTATQLMDVRKEGLDCVLPGLIFEDGINLPEFSLSFSSNGAPKDFFDFSVETTGPLLAQSLVDVIDSFSEILVETLLNQLPNLSQGPLRERINKFSREQLQEAHSRECSDYTEDLPDTTLLPLGDIFNFRDSPFDTILNDNMIRAELLNPSSPLDLNRILQSTSFVVDGVGKIPILESATEILFNGANLGHGNVVIGDFRLPEMGTSNGGIIRELNLLDNRPFNRSQPTMTRNYIRFSGPARSEMRLAFTFDKIFKPASTSSSSGSSRSLEDEFLPEITDDAVYNDLSIELSVNNLEITFDIDIRMDIRAFLNLNAGNLLNLYATPNRVNCLLAIFDYNGLVPHSFDVKFDEVSFEFGCVTECNSPLLSLLELSSVGTSDEINKFMTQVAEGALKLIELFLSNGDPDAQQSAESAVANFLNDTIAQAKQECIGLDVKLPEIPPAEELVNVFSILMMGALVGVFFTIILVCYLMLKHQKIKKQRLAELEGKTPEEQTLMKTQMISLAWHPITSTRMRIVICSLLIVSALVILTANFLTLGATLVMRANMFGSETMDIPIFDFTLETSVNDAWNSGAQVLALLIVVASAYWQYTKLISLTICFFIPPTVLSPKRREKILVLLDSLGKWSLMDAYLLILLQVAFRIHITSETLSLLSLENTTLQNEFGQLFSVDVILVPKFGVMGFALGVAMSLIVNHILVYYGRKSLEYDEELQNKAMGFVPTTKLHTSKKNIARFRFFVTKDAKDVDEKATVLSSETAQAMVQRKLIYQVRPEFAGFVMALGGFTTVLLVLGFILDSIAFEINGIAGLALRFIDPSLTSISLSIIDFLPLISDGQPTDVGQTITSLVLQLFLVMFVIVTPIALIVMLMHLFFGKMRLESQKILHFMAEITGAWETVLVMALAFVASVFQIQLLADFIVTAATGNGCSFLRDQLVSFGVAFEDATCVDLQAGIPRTGYAFLTGGILLVFLNFFLTNLHDVAIENRENLAKFQKAKIAGHGEQMAYIASNNVNPDDVKGFFKRTALFWAIIVTKRKPKQKNKFGENDVVFKESDNPRFSKGKTSADPEAPTEFEAIHNTPHGAGDGIISVQTGNVPKGSATVLQEIDSDDGADIEF